ncbi:MAG: methyl-accepting chemotaxis sensory transducer [Gemmatimonadetes bacterium]|nr:methyl-accepting chemotaxis sensory transducer [Gemmatimonadota bacterium]
MDSFATRCVDVDPDPDPPIHTVAPAPAEPSTALRTRDGAEMGAQRGRGEIAVRALARAAGHCGRGKGTMRKTTIGARRGVARLGEVPFRWQLVITTEAVVFLTVLLLLVPAYLTTRGQVANAYRERLTALARGAALSVPAARVDSVAAQPGVTVPFVGALSAVRGFWRDPVVDSVGAPVSGMMLVRREGPAFRVLVHSSWPGAPPAKAVPWTPPAGLVDSLQNLRAGDVPVWWFETADRLVAVSPVLNENSIASGLAVASMDARAATDDAHAQLLGLAWYPVLALASALVLSMLLMRQLARRLQGAVRLAETVAAGDLSARIEVSGRDEVGKLRAAMRGMSQTLSRIIGEVRGGAEAVSAAAAQLTATSQMVAEGTGRQIASVLDTTAGLRQIGASVNQTARHSRAMERAALEGARTAEESGRAVEETVRAMKAITGKVLVIQEIARKTDLLSLNAAIEAARAGEHGRGFGVVAEEIRRLAERCEGAAAEISALVASSMEVAETSGRLIGELVPSIHRTAGLVQEVAAAAHQQAASVDEITGAMGRVDEAAHQNAAAAQQLAATAAEMSAHADLLRTQIAFFRTGSEPAERKPSSEGAEDHRIVASVSTPASTESAGSAEAEVGGTAEPGWKVEQDGERKRDLVGAA